MSGKPQITRLGSHHYVDDFACGVPELDKFLKRYARQNQRQDISQTHVAISDEKVIGYYSLTTAAVAHEHAPDRLKKHLPRYPIPAVLLARLAIDSSWQGKGLGAALLGSAMRLGLEIADIAGSRAMIVDAKDKTARKFYEHFGFEPFEQGSMRCYRLFKDIREMVAKT